MLIRNIKYRQIQDTLQIGSAVTQSILHDYLGLTKITCRWLSHFLTEVQNQDRVDYCLAMLKSSMEADQNVSMTLSMVIKVGFTITIRRRSVKVKFRLQEIIHFQAKFVDNLLSATDIFAIFSL